MLLLCKDCDDFKALKPDCDHVVIKLLIWETIMGYMEILATWTDILFHMSLNESIWLQFIKESYHLLIFKQQYKLKYSLK